MDTTDRTTVIVTIDRTTLFTLIVVARVTDTTTMTAPGIRIDRQRLQDLVIEVAGNITIPDRTAHGQAMIIRALMLSETAVVVRYTVFQREVRDDCDDV